jgi:hypothetical protein
MQKKKEKAIIRKDFQLVAWLRQRSSRLKKE